MKNIFRERYNLAPQMKEYDMIGIEWLPYLMYFHTPNYSSDVVNTDSRGFRFTYKDDNKILNFSNIDKWPVCLFVGSSAAFGVGATNDKNTIPSILNSNSDHLWLNFGGRAFCSTQELLLFMVNHNRIKNIKEIVIFSGINNILLYYLSQRYSKEFGTFFYNNHYTRLMSKIQWNSMPARRKIMAMALQPIFGEKINYARIKKKELLGYFSGKKSKIDSDNSIISSVSYSKIEDHDKRKEDLLPILRHDIDNWKLFSEALGIKLCYVLQPLANWIHRRLAKQEEILFAELNDCPINTFTMLKNSFGHNQYIWFSSKMKEICGSRNISFFDMNEGMSKRRLDEKWLFVDRIHMTDEGYRIVSKILEEEVIYK